MNAYYDRDTHRRLPEYPGEDTRLTSNKELSGWYSYGWAAEVFVVCGIGSFIPITLEQLARERGMLLSDRSSPCKATFHHSARNVVTGASIASSTGPGDGQCIVQFLGRDINTASFAMYTFSVSVLIQTFVIISMSGAADHGNYRKKLLLSFAFTGALATMLFITIIPKVYLLGALLAIIANTCFGASFVLLNSFLPLLVRHHPSVQDSSPNNQSATRDSEEIGHFGTTTDEEETFVDSSSVALLVSSPEHERMSGLKAAKPASPELRLSTRISSYGIGIGYISAVVVQTLAILIILGIGYVSESTTLALRVALLFVGLWWLLFTIPAAMWLRPRPGPPLSFTSEGKQIRSWIGYIIYAWQSLGKTLLRARHLKDVLLFLAAWFLLSDGIATVSGTAVLFAKTQLQMAPPALALINVITTVFGVMGAFSWSKLSSFFNVRPSQTIIACICLFEIIPIYGLLGYIPAIKRLGVLGLQQPWEMYPLGALYGLAIGGLSSYCRSVFGELIPPGSEAAFYALYAITDKGSSVFGPAIVGAITDRYGEIRPAFVFLAIVIFLPLPLMTLVDVDRGRRDGAAMAKELEGKKDLDSTHASVDGTIVLIDEEADDQENHTS